MLSNKAGALAFGLAGQQSVRYSSGRLKELGIRIKSVKNIQKITKTMNMISSAKYAKAAKQLSGVRGFAAAGAGAVNSLTAQEGYTAPAGNHLIVVSSSDRGLCGALHTNICKAALETAQEKGAGNYAYVACGEKAFLALRAMKEVDNIVIKCTEVGRNDPTFAECAALAQTILEHDYEWAAGTVLYNHHKSAMTQEIKPVGIASLNGLETSPGIEVYDSVDASVMQNFVEYSLAATLYGCIKENYCSEQAARMISMDGATKNAGEMIDRMTLMFNRLRQAVITTELCEIIAGMSAL